MRPGEEWLDFHPRDNVVREVRTVEQGSCGRKVPPVPVERHEAEGAVGHGEE